MINAGPVARLYALAICSMVLAAASQAAARGLTIDDVMALKSVSEPRVSPDGRWVAYTVEAVDDDEDESRSAVFIVSTDGDTVLQMTNGEESSSNPRWSPDGRYLGFVSARGEEDSAKPQLWTLDLRGGEARAYTRVTQGVSDYRWAPDGARVLLMIKDQSAQELADAAAKEEGEDPKPQPWVIDRLQFKQDGTTYLDRSRTHVYVQEGRDGEPRQLTFGDYDDGSPAWSPNGRHIAFVSNRTAEPDSNENTDIWLVAADSEDEQPEPRRLTTNEGADYAPAFSPDGKSIAYVTVTEPDIIWYATNHLALVDVDSGKERVLTESLDRNVRSPLFSTDGKRVYFLLEDSAEQQLAAIEPATGTLDRLVTGNVSVSGFDRNAAGATALTISTPEAPDDVFLLQGGKLNRLTTTNAESLADIELGAMRNITFPSRDGTEIEGFLFTPPDYVRGRRYPTLLWIHGGPVSQYDFGFNQTARLFAAKGYAVLTVNPRGSSGYGQDFSHALWAQWGVKDFEDVMAAVDYAIGQGVADPDRLGVGGWSYGGILTNYVITKSDRFAGAMTGASEVLYTSNYGHDHYQKAWEKELGLPWENQAAWDAISPFYDVDKVTTPTLIMGGKDDWNVPINNSEQLYQALKRLGVDTQLVVYPGESHGFTTPSLIRDRYTRYLDWYDRRVRGN